MYIYELTPEQSQVAMGIIIKELKAIGFDLDIEKAGDRQKAFCLACNLRMKFNELGGLA